MSTQGIDEMSHIFALKRTLRRGMLNTLKAMSDGDIEAQSQAVTRLVLDSPYFKNARSVGCYLSMKHGELRTNKIVEEALLQNKKLYIPYLPPPIPSGSHAPVTLAPDEQAPSSVQTTLANGKMEAARAEMRMLRLYNMEDLQNCPTDKWGIIDPGEKRCDSKEKGKKREDAMEDGVDHLDLILIPGVAFDRYCNRLGRGKAFYDRFLLAYTSKRSSPLLVALALSPQVLPLTENVPTTDTDFRLDGVIHPKGINWRDEGNEKEEVQG